MRAGRRAGLPKAVQAWAQAQPGGLTIPHLSSQAPTQAQNCRVESKYLAGLGGGCRRPWGGGRECSEF